MKIKAITLALTFAAVSPVIAEEAITQEQVPAVVITTEEASVSATEQPEVKKTITEDEAPATEIAVQ